MFHPRRKEVSDLGHRRSRLRRGRGSRRTRPAGPDRPVPRAGMWQAVLGTWKAVLKTSALLVVVTLLAYVLDMTFAVGPFEIGAARSCKGPEVVHVPVPAPAVAPMAVSRVFG